MAKLTNNISKGLLRNANKLTQNKDYYSFGLNWSLVKEITDRSTKVSENKLAEVLSLNDTPYLILGTTWLGKEEYVFFIKNKTSGANEIWLVNKDIKTLKYADTELNFQFNKTISTTYRVDFKGDRLIYFVDGFNKDRVINIDKIQLSSSIISLDLVPYYDSSYNVKISTIEGGKLLQGNYTVAVSFLDENNVESNIKSISNTLSIGDGLYFENRNTYPSEDNYFEVNKGTFINTRGLSKDAQSTKGIKLNIQNTINSNYVYMNIYVVRKNEETTEVKVLENVIITQEITILGSENFVTLGNSLVRLISTNILYNSSEVITQKDNRLIRANTKIDTFNQKFQALANSIKVSYTTTFSKSMKARTTDSADIRIPRTQSNKNINNYETTILIQSSSPDYLSNNTGALNKTFSRDEVYALGVYFELEGGTLTDVYHIPGRVADTDSRLSNGSLNGLQDEIGRIVGTDNNGSWDTANITMEGETKPAWRLINTAVGNGFLGYYRCDSVYPDGYGFPTDGEKDLNGKSYIRHHRIPSDVLLPLAELYASRTAGTGGTTNSPGYSDTDAIRTYIGLVFDLTIPTELLSVIRKVYYTYTPKNNTNKYVLGKGISYFLPGNRQSDQLNRYANLTHISNGYEIYTPEGMFKFKESNISAKRVKPTAIVQGVVRYITKAAGNNFPIPGSITPQWHTYLNSEGANLKGLGASQTIDSYNYKQLVRFDNVFYNYRVPLVAQDKRSFRLNDIKFIDANSVTTLNNQSVNLSGSTKSIYYSLSKGNTRYLDLSLDLYQSSLDTTNGLSDLNLNYPVPADENYSRTPSLVPEITYTDAVAFCTLLSDNFNIDNDLIHLQYATPNLVYTNNGIDDILTLEGDSYIDVMHGKRGFSSVTSGTNILSNKSNNEFIILRSDGGTITPDYDNTDTYSYNDFFAFYTESQLNMRMRYSTQERDYYPNNTINVINLANTFEKQVDKDENYDLDDGYNTVGFTNYNANTIKLSDEYISQRRLETRMVYSEVQNNESKVDNYRTALANNYRDLITTTGGIYQMFTKQERLYAITRDSLFLINTGNQALKTDSSYNITVGTGEFFGIEPNEVISIEGGIGGTSSKSSLNESPYGYLYVDKYKNKIMLFNDSLLDINTLGLQEDFTLEMEKAFPDLIQELDSPQLKYGISTGYDPETHRLIVTKLDYKPLTIILDNYKGIYNDSETYLDTNYYIKNNLIINHGTQLEVDYNDSNLFENKSLTVSFDPIQRNWISYHTYFPYKYINHSNKLKPVLENINEFSDNYSDIQVLEVVINDEALLTKVFDSLELDVRSEDILGNSTNDFFTEYIAYNDKQSTGLVTLNNTTVTKKENNWNINNLKDDTIDYSIKKLFVSDWNSIKDNYYIDKVVNPSIMTTTKEWYKRGRLRDKYLIVRFIRNNLDNKKIICNFVNSNIRISTR